MGYAYSPENIMVYPNEEGRYVDTKFIDFDSIQIGELESDAVTPDFFYNATATD